MKKSLFLSSILTVSWILCFAIYGYSQLSFTITSDTIAYPDEIGISGECVIEVENQASSPTLLSIIRLENDVAPDWITAICTWELCHFSSVDSVSIEVPPLSTKEVKIYFQFLTSTIDTARCLMLFRDEENEANNLVHDFYGVSSEETLDLAERKREERIRIAPNPFHSATRLLFPDLLQNEKVNIISASGVLIRSFLISGDSFQFHREMLPEGMYLLQFDSGKYPTERLVIY